MRKIMDGIFVILLADALSIKLFGVIDFIQYDIGKACLAILVFYFIIKELVHDIKLEKEGWETK